MMVPLPDKEFTVNTVFAIPSEPVVTDAGEIVPSEGLERENATFAPLTFDNGEACLTCTVIAEVPPSPAISQLPVFELVMVDGDKSAAEAMLASRRRPSTSRIVRFTNITTTLD